MQSHWAVVKTCDLEQLVKTRSRKIIDSCNGNYVYHYIAGNQLVLCVAKLTKHTICEAQHQLMYIGHHSHVSYPDHFRSTAIGQLHKHLEQYHSDMT